MGSKYVAQVGNKRQHRLALQTEMKLHSFELKMFQCEQKRSTNKTSVAEKEKTLEFLVSKLQISLSLSSHTESGACLAAANVSNCHLQSLLVAKTTAKTLQWSDSLEQSETKTHLLYCEILTLIPSLPAQTPRHVIAVSDAICSISSAGSPVPLTYGI